MPLGPEFIFPLANKYLSFPCLAFLGAKGRLEARSWLIGHSRGLFLPQGAPFDHLGTGGGDGYRPKRFQYRTRQPKKRIVDAFRN